MKLADGTEILAESGKVDRELLKAFKGDPAKVAWTTAGEVAEKMQPFYRRWTVCLNMLAGNQWIPTDQWKEEVERIRNILDRKRPEVVRAQSNRLLPAYDQKLGRLLSVLHVPEVIPQATRADQYNLALTQSQYLWALWWWRRLDEKDAEIKSYATSLGLCYLKQFWNRDDNLPDFETITAFELGLYPWGVRSIHKATSTIETQAIPYDELATRYPEAMKGWDEKRSAEEDNGQLQGSTDSFLVRQGEHRELKGMVTVREIHRRPTGPSGKFPKGYLLICAKDRLLELRPLDDPDLWPGYYSFKYRYFPGTAHPEGLVGPNIGDQVLLNHALSCKASHVFGQARPRLMLPDSSNCTADMFTDSPLPVEYEDDSENPKDARPWWLAPGQMDPGIDQWIGDLRGSMDDNLQLHDASRGAAVSGVRSNSQLTNLQMRDEVATSPMLEREYGGQWARVFEDSLALTARNRKGEPLTLPGIDPRTASPFTLQDFRLETQTTSFRVRVRTISRAPWDKLMNQEKNLQLLQYGAYNDLAPKDVRQVFQHDVDISFFGPEQADRVEAIAENALILTGKHMGVQFWNNDPVHVEEHKRECMSEHFAQASGDIQAAMSQHMTAHNNRVAQKMQAQQMLTQGAPQGPGAPAGGP